MKIHKAGYGVILVFLILLSIINGLMHYADTNLFIQYPILIVSILIFLFVVRFFRQPNRNVQYSDDIVIAPADGKIVAIEEVNEADFLNEKRIQVSIFMSVWSVHINWFPMLGDIMSSQHFSGRYMAAWLPKSSTENERSVVVLNTTHGKVLIRQIAGAVARRIITYAKPQTKIEQGDQLGFIRFGSRVDVLLPTTFKINVKLGDMVTGGLSKIAEIGN